MPSSHLFHPQLIARQVDLLRVLRLAGDEVTHLADSLLLGWEVEHLVAIGAVQVQALERLQEKA